MFDQAISRLPIRDNIKQRIRQLRSNDKLEAAPNDPNFISIPAALCQTHRKSQFLRSDTGPGMQINILSVICHIPLLFTIVFASNEQLAILRSARHFMSDGTFKVVPEIFYQLYIIHAVYRDRVLPLCSALLRRKDASTYDRLFNEILKFVPGWA